MVVNVLRKNSLRRLLISCCVFNKAIGVCARVVVALLVAPQWCYAQPLPALIEGVLSQHPSVRAQRAQGESAKQAVEAARWQFYPTPSIGFEQLDASPSDTSYPSFGGKSVTTLRLQQPLWTGGRLTAGLDKAQAGVVASQAALEGTRQDLAVRVVQIYADWYGALLKHEAFAKSLQVHQSLQEQIVRRIANGVSPQSDLNLLLGRAQQTEADLSAALAQEQSSLQRLGQLLGHPVQPQALAAALSAPLAIGPNPKELLEQAQVQSPSILRLQAQAQIAQAEIVERQADLKPDAYLRAERQYGSFSSPNSEPNDRFFLGFTSRFGAGLSSLSQVKGAQARYDAALAEVDAGRISLGEQIQADHAQAQAGLTRLKALVASLESSDNIATAWGRQFVAGRKGWQDLMNAVREQAQLETQIADAKSSQLLLSWRLAIVGRGLEVTLLQAASAPVSAVHLSAPAMERPDHVNLLLPLYAEALGEAIALRMAGEINASHLGVTVGMASDSMHADGPSLLISTNSPNKGSW